MFVVADSNSYAFCLLQYIYYKKRTLVYQTMKNNDPSDTCYDAALWSSFTVAMSNKLSSATRSARNHLLVFRNIVVFLLSCFLNLGLPSFDTPMHSCKTSFECSVLRCDNVRQ